VYEALEALAEEKALSEKQAAGATTQISDDVRGKLVKFLWQLKKQGLKERSIETYLYYLKQLIRHGANLYDPESVKETLAKIS